VNASFGVFATANDKEHAVGPERKRITASVAAMTGGESTTINLNLVRSSAMGIRKFAKKESKSAGVRRERGPVGNGDEVGNGGGAERKTRFKTGNTGKIGAKAGIYFPLAMLRRRPIYRVLRRSAINENGLVAKLRKGKRQRLAAAVVFAFRAGEHW